MLSYITIEFNLIKHYRGCEKMKINKVSIKGIGGIDELDLEFKDGINMISGANGIGKTTILNIIKDAFTYNNRKVKRMEKHILELVHQFASSMLENRKIVKSKNHSKDMETNVAELLKQSRQLSFEKMKLYDEYKDDRIDRELYKQKAGQIGRQLEEIRRKIAESERDAKMLEQNNTAKKMKLEEFLNMEKFDTEKLREIIKVIRVHSQEYNGLIN